MDHVPVEQNPQRHWLLEVSTNRLFPLSSVHHWSIASIEALVVLYFKHIHPTMPIIHPETFWRSFKREEDLHDQRAYSLLVALCAALCVSVHYEPMPQELMLLYGSWEDLGRAFNAAVPPKRTRDMFAGRSSAVVQNIMLIALSADLLSLFSMSTELGFHNGISYESAVGSNIAIHLVNEAIRFAIAYRYDREDTTISPVEAQTRKLIFFTLYQWSTFGSLMSGNPLAIRSDESHQSLPLQSNGAFAMPRNDAPELEEERAFVAFNATCSLCLVIEG